MCGEITEPVVILSELHPPSITHFNPPPPTPFTANDGCADEPRIRPALKARPLAFVLIVAPVMTEQRFYAF